MRPGDRVRLVEQGTGKGLSEGTVRRRNSQLMSFQHDDGTVVVMKTEGDPMFRLEQV